MSKDGLSRSTRPPVPLYLARERLYPISVHFRQPRYATGSQVPDVPYPASLPTHPTPSRAMRFTHKRCIVKKVIIQMEPFLEVAMLLVGSPACETFERDACRHWARSPSHPSQSSLLCSRSRGCEVRVCDKMGDASVTTTQSRTAFPSFVRLKLRQFRSQQIRLPRC